ncbi:hypothetical protein SCHPADRAFT_526812 [Schizopora paradoxa]|uniref:Uncharacterized protein n=1 Tax=Schizopora paradoxa TaxID=27342 RepID=A0A0H2REI0_9AGAM|nr:hypothetical protein SCHPADRAFT_526812 [Schizopora paradoxa]
MDEKRCRRREEGHRSGLLASMLWFHSFLFPRCQSSLNAYRRSSSILFARSDLSTRLSSLFVDAQCIDHPRFIRLALGKFHLNTISRQLKTGRRVHLWPGDVVGAIKKETAFPRKPTSRSRLLVVFLRSNEKRGGI